MREDLRESSDGSGTYGPHVIQLRVPGPWASPRQLDERLAEAKTGYHLDRGSLVHEKSGTKIEMAVTEHDAELAPLFRGCYNAHTMTEEQFVALGAHTVKVHVHGPGGSPDAARPIVRAAAALVRAGGLGVFVDNSGLCHAPQDFLKLADDEQPGGVFWTFVALNGSRGDDDDEPEAVWSTGMHCLGLREAELRDVPDDPKLAAFVIHNFLGYAYQSGAVINDGDMLGAPDEPQFRVREEPDKRIPPDHPMHNPYGYWILEPVLESGL